MGRCFHDGSEEAVSTTLAVVARMAAIAAVLAVLDLLFWSAIQFEPTLSVTWPQRFYLVGVTALGPIGLTWIESVRTLGWVTCGWTLASVAAALRWRRTAWIQVLAYLSILAWWFWGFLVALAMTD